MPKSRCMASALYVACMDTACWQSLSIQNEVHKYVPGRPTESLGGLLIRRAFGGFTCRLDIGAVRLWTNPKLYCRGLLYKIMR